MELVELAKYKAPDFEELRASELFSDGVLMDNVLLCLILIVGVIIILYPLLNCFFEKIRNDYSGKKAFVISFSICIIVTIGIIMRGFNLNSNYFVENKIEDKLLQFSIETETYKSVLIEAAKSDDLNEVDKLFLEKLITDYNKETSSLIEDLNQHYHKTGYDFNQLFYTID